MQFPFITTKKNYILFTDYIIDVKKGHMDSLDIVFYKICFKLNNVNLTLILSFYSI